MHEVFDDETERKFCKLAYSAPDGVDISISIDVRIKPQNRIDLIYIDIKEDDDNYHQIDEYKQTVSNLLIKMSSLHISTKTPQTVVPWILQFSNLQSLDVGTVEAENGELVDDKIISEMELDLDQLSKVAIFKKELTINFYGSYYCCNEQIRRYLREICKKFKQEKRLSQFNVWENYDSIKPQILSDCRAHETKWI